MSHRRDQLAGGAVNHVGDSSVTDEGLADSIGRYLAGGVGRGVVAGRGAAGAARDACGLHPAVADQRSFPAERNSVRAARHYVTGLLGEGADEEAAFDTAIVTTELAANAVLHARTGFTLTVSRSAGVTRIAVRDSTPVDLHAVTDLEAAGPQGAGPQTTGPQTTGPQTTGPQTTGPLTTRPRAAGEGAPFQVMKGHGLSVVAQLASRWAVEPLPDGKVVWAELPAPRPET